MPNWCEGTLKVRGKRDDLTKFVLEGLHPVDMFGEKVANLDFDEDGDLYYDGVCYIDGTYRGFVDGVNIVYLDDDKTNPWIAFFEARFAWGINAEELLKLCLKYNVDMKIQGFECGMQFNQIIEIVDGEILENQKIRFENYAWDCVCPTIGG